MKSASAQAARRLRQDMAGALEPDYKVLCSINATLEAGCRGCRDHNDTTLPISSLHGECSDNFAHSVLYLLPPLLNKRSTLQREHGLRV